MYRIVNTADVLETVSAAARVRREVLVDNKQRTEAARSAIAVLLDMDDGLDSIEDQVVLSITAQHHRDRWERQYKRANR